jgi:uncharacterized membrane protein YcaP (DUF421 family)
METLIDIFGRGGSLTVFQMSMRATLVFVIAIILLRISGRRSFGLQMPLDNVIAILLGAILSRGVVGASPFLATLAAGTALVLLHRIFGMLAVYNKRFDLLVKGEEKLVYSAGKIIMRNMHRCMLSKADLMEGVRTATHGESLECINKIYVERDGKITVVMKEAR